MIERLEQFFDRWTLTAGTAAQVWIIAAVVILFSLLAYVIISRILFRIGRKAEKDTISLAWRKFHNPVLALVLLLDITLVKELFTLGEDTEKVAGQVITIVYIVTITWLLIRAINLVRELILREYDVTAEDNLKARKVSTQLRVLERVIIFLVILIATGIALMTFEGIKRIGISIFASAGVAGIIIGFAAQKLLGSILAGFQIALTQPIRIDDVVIVEGEWGRVEEITLTYVVVRIWDKRRLIVPSTYFIEKPFQNWTRVSADILGTVYIYTDYRVSVERIREELNRILENTSHWDGQVSVVQVTGATDSTMEIRALMSAVDSSAAWNLRVHVREQLIRFLQEEYPESLPRTRVEMMATSEEELPHPDQVRQGGKKN